MNPYAIAIHGGAGTILRRNMTPRKEARYKKGLEEAIDAGEQILLRGGSALDAVQAALMLLEDHPLFNAGRGSVFTHEGKIEMDASIMNGANLMAGAVSAVRNIKNPIRLARAVMEKSEHVFLCGPGAMKFAEEQGIAFAPDSYFFNAQRYKQWQKANETGAILLDHDALETGENKFGTAGVVALDPGGNLAAGTSTGGMTNKKYGRVGDSPLIGAGTYANNLTCAVSCTGYGEYFIRSVVAYDVSCLMEYKGLTLQQACNHVVHEKLVRLGGEGGLIALDSLGNIAMPFNSEGMYRAMKRQGEPLYLGIYKD
jgi:L-asparaginase / beta-aspartyl-peptidase